MFGMLYNMRSPHGANLDIWGKWDDSAAGYPLLGHLLDSALMGEILFEEWLPSRLIKQIDAAVAGSTMTSREIVMLAAGLHDLGKATPIFQGQMLSRFAPEFFSQKEGLEESGLWFPSGVSANPPQGKERHMISRHEVASGLFMEGEVGTDPHSFSSVISGHHGRWRLFGEVEADDERLPVSCTYYRELLSRPGWVDEMAAHQEEVKHILGLTPPSHKNDFDRAAVPLLTSIVCLADWLVSTDTSVSNGRIHEELLEKDPGAFYEARRFHLTELFRKTLGTPRRPTQTFDTVFGFPPTRPVQGVMVKKTEPGLTVAMVPMGEGKTEAALGQWLLSAEEKQGLYFALPTMATADAMFERVRKLFSYVEDPVLGTLAHGRSILNSFYQQGEEHHIVTIDDNGKGGLTPQDWFTGRHRSLLSPITVGTIDQLLAGVLRHKYNFMRILGAATKTVILDEVHTYDPYMSELLIAFLTWAGRFNIDVVLLSATLPERRLRSYLAAYASGSGHKKELVVSPAYPSVVRFSEHSITTHDLSDSLSGREVEVSLDWVGVESDIVGAVIERADTILTESKEVKLGIIMNTVAGAQNVASGLVKLGHSPGLLHARMTSNERNARTDKAISDFGKDSAPGLSVLVSTQIVEASMDLDFDILITQICPAPSLLQRSGRVWRHNYAALGSKRLRPEGLKEPTVVVVHQNPLPETPYSFLPYSPAEIHKTYTSLDCGQTPSIRIPEDVQRLVDASDVTLADITSLGGLATDSVISEKIRVMRSKNNRIPLPKELSNSLKSLEDFTAGELDSEEYGTRWIDSLSVTILPISKTNSLAWSGPTPANPSSAMVVGILGYTVSVTGAFARKVYEMVIKRDSAFISDVFKNRLLSDVIVVDLDVTDKATLDPLLGLVY